MNLADEGYLWYGAIAVLRGEVPMRDFQSYDPGRYYWMAPWLALLGDGIVPLRIGCAALHALGLAAGVAVLRRVAPSAWSLVAGGALLTLWLFPTFMLNHVVGMATVWAAVLLLEAPTLRRHVLAGAVTGLAAFLGRNVGLYALVAMTAVVFYGWWRFDRRDLVRRLAALGAGVAAGYAPMLVMLAVVPGFWQANLDNVRALAEAGMTNLERPVPWPWREPSLWGRAVGTLFVLLPAFHLAALGWLVAAPADAVRRRPVLLAATLVGLPYLHYAFSRPDVEHLALAIHPLLLGVLALPAAATGAGRSAARALVAAVAVVSLLAVGRVSPFWERVSAPPGAYVPTTLGAWTVWMPADRSAFVRAIAAFEEAYVRPDEGLLIAPHLGPGLYPILDRRSPLWQIYFLLPHPAWWQRRMIDQLDQHRVNWVLLDDVGTDWRDDLRFRHTHRLLFEHIVREFDVVPTEGLPPTYRLFHRRSAGPIPVPGGAGGAPAGS